MDGYWKPKRRPLPVRRRKASYRVNAIRKHSLVFSVVLLIIVLIISSVVVFAIAFAPLLSVSNVPQSFRLPLGVIPHRYVLEIKPYLSWDNLTFEGTVDITVLCINATDNVTVHVNNLTIHEASISLSDTGQHFRITEQEEDRNNQFLILYLSEKLLPGKEYIVHFRFSAPLNDSKVGFYWSSYEEDGNKKLMAVTHFEPTDARRLFPCFDEPALKAIFDIVVIRYKNMASLSNMPKRNTEERFSECKRTTVVSTITHYVFTSGALFLIAGPLMRAEDWEADVYHTTVKMSTYLVAIFVGNFSRNGDDKLAVWAPKGNITHTQYALEIAQELLSYFEEILGIPYSLPKLDMIAVPEHKSSAMENWGLVIYQDSYIIYDEESKNDAEKQFTTRIIAHELCHQWFGNLVSPKWWQYIWLSEGLCTYLEGLAVDAVSPGWDMVEELVRSVENIVEYDCSDHSIPVSLKVDRPQKLLRLFNSFTYKKGGMIARMVHHILGNETFWKGLSNYLKDNSFDSVEDDDLWRYFTQAQPSDRGTRIDMKRLMESWIHNRGYPVVTVTRDYDNGRALLTQRSCLSSHLRDRNFRSVWKIPLTYTDGRNPDWTPKVKKWLGSIKGTLFNLPGKDHWILVNVQQAGYYHVNYDLKNWYLLSIQLRNDHKVIPLINRRQLLMDVSYFIRDETLTYDVYLAMAIYLVNEREHKILETLLYSPIIQVDDMVRHGEAIDQWKDYVHSVLGPIYEYLPSTEQSKGVYDVRYLKEQLMFKTCYYYYPPCLDEAKKKYTAWIAGEEYYKKVYSPMTEAVFCTAIKFGNETDWNYVLDLLKSDNESSSSLMYSLGCSRNTSRVQSYLEDLLESEFEAKGIESLFKGILGNEEIWEVLFHFLDQNWVAITESQQLYNRTADGLFKAIGNIKELEKLEEVYYRHDQSLESKENKRYTELEKLLKQRQKQSRDVEKWLKDR